MSQYQKELILQLACECETLYGDQSISEVEFEVRREKLFAIALKKLGEIKNVSDEEEFFCLMFLLSRMNFYFFNSKDWNGSIEVSKKIICISEKVSAEFNCDINEQDFYKYALVYSGYSLIETKELGLAREHLSLLMKIDPKFKGAKVQMDRCIGEITSKLTGQCISVLLWAGTLFMIPNLLCFHFKVMCFQQAKALSNLGLIIWSIGIAGTVFVGIMLGIATLGVWITCQLLHKNKRG